MTAPRRSRARRGAALALALVTITAALPLLPAFPTAGADTAESTTALLPTARDGTAAVWDAARGAAYVIGGNEGWPYGYSDEIVRFTPSSLDVRVVARMPTDLYAAAAVWTGQYAFIFGGHDGSGATDRILRFDPSSGTVTTLTAKLPSGRYAASAVWSGQYAYVIGGCLGGAACNPTDQIVRFDPASGAVQTEFERLPSGRAFTSAIWLPADEFRPDRAMIFGGYLAAGPTDQIVLYYPGDGAWVDSQNKFDTARYGTSVALSPSTKKAWIYGGIEAGGLRTWKIEMYWKFFLDDPPRSSIAAVAGTSAVFDGVNAWVFGGSNADGSLRRDVVKHHLVPTPPHPIGVERDASPGRLVVSWGNPRSNSYDVLHGYLVYRRTSSTSLSLLTSVSAGSNSFVDSGLEAGTTYYYAVSATSRSGEGPRTSVGSATTHAPPSAPQDFDAARGADAHRIDLSWKAPATTDGLSIQTYKVYRGEPGAARAYYASVGNVLSWSDGVASGATYCYSVRAVTAAGEGAESGSDCATSHDVPAAPTGVAATAGPDTGQITVSWHAPSSTLPITDYRVYRGTSSTSLGYVASTGTSRTFTDSGLANGGVYWYAVTAVSDAGQSAMSAAASAETFHAPTAPRNPAASAGPGVGEIAISWQPPADAGGLTVTSYRVYVSSGSGWDAGRTVGDGSARSWTHSGLPEGATRWYRIVAVNAVGEGTSSATVSATTFVRPSAPQSLSTTTGPSRGSVSISWSPPASNGGMSVEKYRIYEGESSGGGTLLAEVSAASTSYVRSGLPDGATRYYRVSAVTPVGEGALSAEASGRAPWMPGAPRLHTVEHGPLPHEITVHWDAPSDTGGVPLYQYVVYRGANPWGLTPLAAVDASETRWTDPAPMPGANYYRVHAVNTATIQGPGSEVGCAVPTPWGELPLGLAAECRVAGG